MDVALDDLEAVVVLAETLHFGRAADRLHVSQPALSKRIKRLEERIGGPLLVRGYRDVRLTEAGRLLAGRGRHVIQESAATVALSQRAARGEAGLLRIGFGIATILGLVPDVLLRFRRAYPEVQLSLRDMPTPDQVSALANREIDVGFVRRPVSDDRLVMRPVLDERLVAALGPRSPWVPKLGLLIDRVVRQSVRSLGCGPWPASPSSSSRERAPPATTTTLSASVRPPDSLLGLFRRQASCSLCCRSFAPGSACPLFRGRQRSCAFPACGSAS